MKKPASTLVGVALLLTACADDPRPEVLHPAPAPSTDEPLPAYDASDYTYTLRVNCFCPDGGVPVSVTVRDGEVVDAVYVHEGRGHAAGAPAGKWHRLTIDDVIEAANDAEATGAAVVDVKWPDGQAYPRSVWIDRDRNVVDEEVGYVISNVSPA